MQQDTRQPVAPNDVVGLLQQLNAHTMLLRLLTSRRGRPRRPPRERTRDARGARRRALDLDAGRLHRVLRFVASYGFFREDEAGRYHLSPRAEALRADVPGRYASGCASPGTTCCGAATNTADALRAGQSVRARARQAGVRASRRASGGQRDLRPLDGATFADREPGDRGRLVLRWRALVVDVAGGHGGLLAAVLDTHPAPAPALRPAAGGGRAGGVARAALRRPLARRRRRFLPAPCRPAATSTCSSASCTTGMTPAHSRSCAAAAPR